MAEKPKRRRARLRDVDLSKSLSRGAYERKLTALQRTLAQIQQALLLSGDSAVIVFEGWDAAGKGGTIRRIAAALDPRSFKVWPIGPPRKYYLERHYLTRFVERLPPNGAITIFDRSWYGRVLVERVEGLTAPKRWREAYDEINAFEHMLTRDGTRIVKLFLHISPEEQLDRFEKRLRNPLKRWKLSYEDFRNRGRWDDYFAATEEMLSRTSPRHAPWHVIAANDKKHARVAAIQTIVKRLGRGLDLGPPPMQPRVVEAAESHLDLEPDLIASLAGRTE